MALAVITAEAEKRGIPSVMESWNDSLMNSIAKEYFMLSGVPQCRQVLTPPDTMLISLEASIPDFIDALTRPLTAEEQESGTYQAPIPPRIAMTGTLDEVQAYFEGDLIAVPFGGPWAWMTDGGPIIPPTEDRVARMLQGTSHSPDEEILFTRYGTRIANIGKVAINAVMAGCKPEYMPAVLAMAESGACVGYGGDAAHGHMYVVSGPYAKEIGMNFGFSFLNTGNPANVSLERVCSLMGINLGGCRHSVNNGVRLGGMYWGTTFAEDPNTPWDTLNVHFGYDVDESVLFSLSSHVRFVPGPLPGGYNPTSLVEFQSGSPRQALEVFDSMAFSRGAFLVFSADTAKRWKGTYGFDSIQEIQDYFWENVVWPAGDWYEQYHFAKKGGYGKIAKREPGTRQLNPDHLDLPPDTLIPRIDNPDEINVIVAGGSGEAWGYGSAWRFRPYSIDKWR